MKYELDNIYNEDSYKAIKNIPDNSIDCIYTDVPYLYVYGGDGNSDLAKRASKRKNELIDSNLRDGFDYVNFIAEAIRVMKKVNIMLWCSKWQLLDIMNEFKKHGDYMFELLTWNKLNPPPLTNSTWLGDIEYCFHFKEKGIKLNDGYKLKSKWHTSSINKKDKDLYNHPTIKPIDLVKRHLKHITQPNDIVADFFLGSGTTCVAAKELNRRYIGFEIDQEYYKIAKDRLNGITAQGQMSVFTDFERLDI